MITLNYPFKFLLKTYIQLRRFCINAFKIQQFTINFVLRNSLAALIAMGVAWLFGSHEYYWAAVTSWVMAINGRGKIISKSLYRTAGTAIGALFAFAIMPLASLPWLYILVLSLWGALCASTACLLRRFRAYTASLAGYTATIIGGFILVTPPELHVGFAVERFVSVLIGMASATLVALVLIPKTDRKEVGDETRQWAKRTMNWAAHIIQQSLVSKQIPPSLDLWRGISEFEYSCTCAAIESNSIKKYLPTIRSLLASQLALVSGIRAFCRLRTVEYNEYYDTLREVLLSAASKIANHDDIQAEIDTVKKIADTLNHKHKHMTLFDQTISAKINSIVFNLIRIQQDFALLNKESHLSEDNIPSMSLHYDWERSISTGIRTFIPTLLVGILWLHIGGAGWIFAFVMTSIASVLFGTFPGATKVLKGFLASITAASVIFIIWCLFVHWLHLGMFATFIAVVIFSALAAFPLSNGYPRAMDFNTNFPVLMLGMGAEHFSISTQLTAGFGLMLGVIVTYIALWLPVRHENSKVASMNQQIDLLINRLVSQQWTPHQRIWEECIYDLMAQASLLSLSKNKLSHLLSRYQIALDDGTEIIWLRSAELKKELPRDVYEHIDHGLNSILHFKNLSHVRQELLKTAIYILKKQQHSDASVAAKECMHQAAASLVSLSHGLKPQM